jgi:Flp pilus assembly pilin Flp
MQAMLELYVNLLNRLTAEEEGQTMAEYGVILAVITAGVLAAITALGGGVDGALDRVTAMLRPAA